ncbi:MAG: hypothetical protein HeimC2_43900 [Candidatus Heimdallarchaeota archaeon LC_2]|nr:MAG: hypothetical protein HeimC2_43900 [Candidatus Heimdallarchaeota archaeon LC_2]
MVSVNFHDWFLTREYPQGLKDYMRKFYLSIDLAMGYKPNPDTQVLYFSFIRAVLMDLLPPFTISHENRLERMTNWADADTLLRMPFNEYTPFTIGKKIHLPRISLENFVFTSENWMNPPKYDWIGDGNHRFVKAKEIGMNHVLCEVTERFVVNKDEMGEAKEKDDNDTYYQCSFCDKKILEIDFNDHFYRIHGVRETYDEYCVFCNEIIPENNFDHLEKYHPKEYEKKAAEIAKTLAAIGLNKNEEFNFSNGNLDFE